MKFKVGDKVRLKSIKNIQGVIYRISNQNIKPVYEFSMNNEHFSSYEEDLEQTNRQWLESLSDEELAVELVCADITSSTEMKKWLQAEHENKE